MINDVLLLFMDVGVQLCRSMIHALDVLRCFINALPYLFENVDPHEWNLRSVRIGCPEKPENSAHGLEVDGPRPCQGTQLDGRLSNYVYGLGVCAIYSAHNIAEGDSSASFVPLQTFKIPTNPTLKLQILTAREAHGGWATAEDWYTFKRVQQISRPTGTAIMLQTLLRNVIAAAGNRLQGSIHLVLLLMLSILAGLQKFLQPSRQRPCCPCFDLGPDGWRHIPTATVDCW